MSSRLLENPSIVIAVVVCLVVLLIGVGVGRSSKRATTNITVIKQEKDKEEGFDARDFNLDPTGLGHSEEPLEVDPELQWQQHMQSEWQPNEHEPPEDQPHMIRRGVTIGSMVPTRVARTTSEWGSATKMHELGIFH